MGRGLEIVGSVMRCEGCEPCYQIFVTFVFWMRPGNCLDKALNSVMRNEWETCKSYIIQWNSISEGCRRYLLIGTDVAMVDELPDMTDDLPTRGWSMRQGGVHFVKLLHLKVVTNTDCQRCFHVLYKLAVITKFYSA